MSKFGHGIDAEHAVLYMVLYMVSLMDLGHKQMFGRPDDRGLRLAPYPPSWDSTWCWKVLGP